MKCEKCGSENSDYAAFCAKCQTPLLCESIDGASPRVACPFCGASNDYQAEVCYKCGLGHEPQDVIGEGEGPAWTKESSFLWWTTTVNSGSMDSFIVSQSSLFGGYRMAVSYPAFVARTCFSLIIGLAFTILLLFLSIPFAVFFACLTFIPIIAIYLWVVTPPKKR